MAPMGPFCKPRVFTRGYDFDSTYATYEFISIHALREEGDPFISICQQLFHISIHALREEGDSGLPMSSSPTRNFYPRPPRGGRPLHPLSQKAYRPFLSTPSARRATTAAAAAHAPGCISIHALREEGDPFWSSWFSSRTISIHALREEGDFEADYLLPLIAISIHALREEGDPWRSAL